MARTGKYSQEVRERAVRMVFELGLRPGASPLVRYRSGDITVPETEASPLVRPPRAA